MPVRNSFVQDCDERTQDFWGAQRARVNAPYSSYPNGAPVIVDLNGGTNFTFTGTFELQGECASGTIGATLIELTDGTTTLTEGTDLTVVRGSDGKSFTFSGSFTTGANGASVDLGYTVIPCGSETEVAKILGVGKQTSEYVESCDAVVTTALPGPIALFLQYIPCEPIDLCNLGCDGAVVNVTVGEETPVKMGYYSTSGDFRFADGFGESDAAAGIGQVTGQYNSGSGVFELGITPAPPADYSFHLVLGEGDPVPLSVCENDCTPCPSVPE